MERIWKAKFYLSTLITTIVFAINYQVKQNSISISPLLFAFLVILVFILSTLLADNIGDLALRSMYVRRKIIGEIWIEGYWKLKTYENQDNSSKLNSSKLSSRGILDVKYVRNELYVVAHRRKGNQTAKDPFTVSNLAYIKSPDLYCNVFSLFEKTDEKGVATGRFFKHGYTDCLNYYEGHIFLFSDRKIKSQTGRKLINDEIKEYVEEDPKNWIENYLNSEKEWL